ncbi:LOW QUALITY PROTEIN: synaptopodin-2 [Cololabis saira]|uniref:LOW QUALITY PROTEIN: synaptopodin-2 n=1 Tax=Cololabis saira TaxID=129043 RepID=UPI002AD29852|nr:LOW QUALITY PROTEIN: synaptopodin-2 [Cololabis saira]
MGTGDYICLTLRGAAPWGFSLQEGEGDTHTPFLVSQVEEGGRAFLAGIQDGDEVVSINGNPCADLTLSRAFALIDTSVDCLQLLVKRYHFTPHGGCESEETCCVEGASSDEPLESTTLHILSTRHKSQIPGEIYLSTPRRQASYEDVDSRRDFPRRSQVPSTQRYAPANDQGGHELVFEREVMGVPLSFSSGNTVELQVSLAEQTLDDLGSTSLGSARGIDGELSTREAVESTTTSTLHFVPCPAREPLGQHGVVVGSPSMLGQVEVILQQPAAPGEGRGVLSVGGPGVSKSDESQREGQEGGGYCAGVPGSFTVSFEIPSEEATPAEEQDSDSDGDRDKPNKHRARHARLRRNESVSDKQLKEAKSKCKRIALLLTAAPPNPNNRGVLMFKKHRQRAKKYTLVSYGTGEEQQEYSDEEDEEDEDKEETVTGEFTFVASVSAKLNNTYLTGDTSSKGVLTVNVDKGLLEIEKSMNNQAEMESLPDTQGKGALMFAQRRQRMDEISAEHDELRRQGIPVEGLQEAENKVVEQTYMQSTTDGHAYMDVNMHQQSQQQQYQQYQEQQYYEQQQNYQQQQQYQQYQQQQYEQRQYQQQQLYQQQQDYHQEKQQMQQYSTNVNGMVQHQTSEMQSSLSNRTAKPFTAENMIAAPYSHTVSGTTLDSVGQGEQIASRDERISTPAIKTGVLSDSRRKNTIKPMFTFKEAPKVSPNPELLNLLNKSDKKMGFESGPEEDYLSLGAEACNFLQSQRVKPKIPPPVAPKPAINPNSPPWSPQIEGANPDMPQCAENTLSTPAVAPTVETAPALELKPSTAPAPQPPPLPPPAPQETPASANIAGQHAWTVPEPESQPPPPQVIHQEANGPMKSTLQPEPSHMTSWGVEQTQAQHQSSSTSWHHAQVQPQEPVSSQSPTQSPWLTRRPTPNQAPPQQPTNTWTPQSQPSWAQPQEQAQGQSQPQPPWVHPQEQPQSQVQVQPPWGLPNDQPHHQHMQPAWSQTQESMQPQSQNKWQQPSQMDTQHQTPWVQQPQQKPQVQPPWAQQVQPEPQAQPPWVQEQQRQALQQPEPQAQPPWVQEQQRQALQQPEPQAQPPWVQEQQRQALQQPWPQAQSPHQPQPPWVSSQSPQQPPVNTWPQSQTQTQVQPPWIQVAQPQPHVQPQAQPPAQPPAQAQANLNPWAPVPAQTQPQPPWTQHPIEHGQHQMNSWAQEQNQAQHQPPWAQPAPSQPAQQPSWHQPISNPPPQPQIDTWSPSQAQVQTPVNSWTAQSRETPVNVSMSTVNTRPSPKPWQAMQNTPQNQDMPPPPPPPPRRMLSFTLGERSESPINPMATILNPKSSHGSAFEMPVVKGKGADMFAKRLSRMEKFVVDSETVEANKAIRSTSPTPSLPNEWKYTPNAFGRSYSLSPPARLPFASQKPASASSSPKPPTRASTILPTSWLEKGFKRPTPWEAASRHPLGLVDEAFSFQNLQQSLASNVCLAAQRKMMPEAPAEWKVGPSLHAQQRTGSQTWGRSCSQGRAPLPSFISPTKSPVSSPVGHAAYRSLPRRWQPQRYVAEVQPSASPSTYNKHLEKETFKSGASASSTWRWRQ